MGKFQIDWIRKGRVPHLDALRALAIAMVLVSHLGSGLHGVWSGLFNGHLGVTLFFAISGFLITLLLLREFDQTGGIRLRAFYYRRVLRIFPAYYVYLIVGLMLAFIGILSFSKAYWGAAFTYTMCYMPRLDLGWHVGHFWSLAVEEHFYLLWPVIMVIFKPARAWKIILAYIVCIPLVRYAIWALHLDWLDIDFCSITQMSSIAMGCLLAFIVRGDALRTVGDRLKSHPAITLFLGILLLLMSRIACMSGKYIILFSDPVSALACCMIMGGLLYIQNARVNWLLNNSVVCFFGALSYSLYIWQQPFAGPAVVGEMSNTWRVLGIFSAAIASYYMIERPFLRMKDKKAMLSGLDK